MSGVFYTWAELEAFQLCAGTVPISNASGQIVRSADRILELAERIKNSRARATMNLASDAAAGANRVSEQMESGNG